MADSNPKQLKETIQSRYGDIARSASTGCGCSPGACCEGPQEKPVQVSTKLSEKLGYSPSEIKAAPESANLNLGCGNPQAIAELIPGETVLDLGSGAGFDCFLAARQVGPKGKVIGIDMTPDMIKRAKQNAKNGAYHNVEFRLGEIEQLPVESDSIDVIISNCVINLSSDKPGVFREAFRVLKPGGRLAISDTVATAEIPEAVKNDMALFSACISGAAEVQELEQILKDAGFIDIQIHAREESREFIREWAPGNHPEDYIQSAVIKACKPKTLGNTRLSS